MRLCSAGLWLSCIVFGNGRCTQADARGLRGPARKGTPPSRTQRGLFRLADRHNTCKRRRVCWQTRCGQRPRFPWYASVCFPCKKAPSPEAACAYSVRIYVCHTCAVDTAPATNSDLNCGCPTPDVTTRGMGAALLEQPARLAELVGGIVDAIDLPVSVKVRTGGGVVGSSESSASRGVNVREVVAAVVNAGASSVTIHGRTKTDRYTQMANWRDIAAGAQSAAQLDLARPAVAVVGSGDVFTAR